MRLIVVVASLIALVVVAFAIWFLGQQQSARGPADAVEAQRQFDTTGGQEMRPRWDNSGGQGDDAGN